MNAYNKMKKWNINPKRHKYYIKAKVNCKDYNVYSTMVRTYYAYNKEHAIYQFYEECSENNIIIPGKKEFITIDDKFIIKRLA